MSVAFRKRIYTPRTFRESLAGIIDHTSELRAATRAGRVSRAFAERIMLAVTEVNGCRYCSYAHTRSALRAGISAEEVRALLAGELDTVPPEELPALLFAQHYAETGGHPEPEATQRLEEVYGAEGARDILVHIRMITMGNLLGNTLDALFSRLRGAPAPESSLGQEIAVLAGSVLLPPFFMLRRWLAGANQS